MAEYIKRTDAMNAVLVGDVDKDFPCMDIAARLHDIPAADVRPVVRGKWKRRVANSEDDYRENGYVYYICDRCGAAGAPNYRYCPKCGADNLEET